MGVTALSEVSSIPRSDASEYSAIRGICLHSAKLEALMVKLLSGTLLFNKFTSATAPADDSFLAFRSDSL